jgi:hypothetical protein
MFKYYASDIFGLLLLAVDLFLVIIFISILLVLWRGG